MSNLNLKSRYRIKHNLDKDQERKLRVALHEMESRGLKLPPDFSFNSTDTLPISSNGYFTKTDGSLYNATEKQQGFIDNRARFSLFVGGRGSGKTGAGIQKALRKIKAGQSGAIMNPDFENFRYSTWTEVREWFPRELVIPRHRHVFAPGWMPTRPFELTCTTGATVYCKGLKNPDSARGPNINWLWYDEGGRDLDGLGWNIAIASVRVGHEPQAWTTATPSGKDHWMYELFILQDFDEEILAVFLEQEDRDLVAYFEGSIHDNEDNLDPGFYASLNLLYTGWLKLQEVEGQFVDQGGVLGNPKWFDGKILNEIPDDEPIKSRVRYWDFGATEKKMVKKRAMNDPDSSVGTLLSWNGKGKHDTKFFIEDQVGGQWKYEDLVQHMWETALKDTPQVPIWIEEEPGAGGKNQIAAVNMWFREQCKKYGVPNFIIKGDRPDNDKVMRANPWFAEAAEGKFYIIQGKWNDKFLARLSSFPIGSHDDEIDSVSGARKVCAPWITYTDIKFLHL